MSLVPGRTGIDGFSSLAEREGYILSNHGRVKGVRSFNHKMVKNSCSEISMAVLKFNFGCLGDLVLSIMKALTWAPFPNAERGKGSTICSEIT